MAHSQKLDTVPHVTEELRELNNVFPDACVAVHLKSITPEGFSVASDFWREALTCKHLTPRLGELVLLALHASITSLDSHAIPRHVNRAISAGATSSDIMDVLLSIVGVSNHALYAAVPILMDELKAFGKDEPFPEETASIKKIKDEFIRKRGFWSEQRDVLAQCMPGYFSALSALSVEPWNSGSLSPRERELIYIAIDSSVTHMYAAGLRLHIRRALEAGASRDEILEVFQLVAVTGLEGYILGAQTLYENSSSKSDVPSRTK